MADTASPRISGKSSGRSRSTKPTSPTRLEKTSRTVSRTGKGQPGGRNEERTNRSDRSYHRIGSWCWRPASPQAADTPDAWVTMKTKVSLITTEGVSTKDLNVDTVNGIVTLHGKVATEAEKAKAENVARKIEGAKEVKNLLQVVPEAQRTVVERSDADIEKSVKAAFKANRRVSTAASRSPRSTRASCCCRGRRSRWRPIWSRSRSPTPFAACGACRQKSRSCPLPDVSGGRGTEARGTWKLTHSMCLALFARFTEQLHGGLRLSAP